MIKCHELLGLHEQEAIALVKANSYTARVIRRDKELFMHTMELRNNRVNLEIEKGKVVKARIG